MQKRISIDGREVDFKFTLSAFYIFKNQFGYDAMNKIIPTIGEILSGINIVEFDKDKAKEADFVKIIGETLENTFNFEILDISNLIWAFAKNANPQIGEPIVWFNSFESFPIIDVLKELIPCLLESLGTKKKLKMKKNTKTQTKKKE